MAIKFTIKEIVNVPEGTKKRAKGTLEWSEKNLSTPAVSGAYGNGMIEVGEYKARRNFLLDKPGENTYCDTKNNCWFQLLDPQFDTDRTEIGIHPDGNVVGTKGCIGLDPNTDTKLWYNALFSVKAGQYTDVIVVDESGLNA